METNTHYTGNGRLGPALSFTYERGAVALERGVADDKRPRRNSDGTAVLKAGVQREVDVPPPDMEHREPVKRILRNGKTDTHVGGRGVAQKSACLNCQSAVTNENCSSLKQFEFPPPQLDEISRNFICEERR